MKKSVIVLGVMAFFLLTVRPVFAQDAQPAATDAVVNEITNEVADAAPVEAVPAEAAPTEEQPVMANTEAAPQAGSY